LVYSKENENINKNEPLNPYFITGYTDGDGSFSVRFRKSSDSK
jgi:hypothetical protein